MTESTFYPLCQSLSKSQKHEKKKQISSTTSSKFHPRNRPTQGQVFISPYIPVRSGVFGWVSPGAESFQLCVLQWPCFGLSSPRANRGSAQRIPNYPQRDERWLGRIARLAHDLQRASGRK